ncbi:type II toxin-antitoxin system VapC family toxin [Chelativorans sp.]|uniref:type II toxin-antitoxin system VapC family toxin n=1 Tax=Chelativorans sp. TaxID=2203393 RepID=UPI0028109D31|nr:type II toxin-antitoxin system VapC family toxin [Chelativorans sp.]
MFVDASAMVAVLAQEPGWEPFADVIDNAKAGTLITSVLAAWEAASGLSRIKRYTTAEAEERVRRLLNVSGIELVGIGPDELTLALQAFDRYGRHAYPQNQRNLALNLADCFHYASAGSRGLPILHKDQGFAKTDIRSAL